MSDRPSLIGGVTPREQLRWQRRAARLLCDLLERAFHEKLPLPVVGVVGGAYGRGPGRALPGS